MPRHMSLAEFEKLDWPEKDRWELIEGVPCMSPGGMPEHQDLLGILFVYLVNKLGPRGYRVLPDLDIAFPGEESYLRPDISAFAPDQIPKRGKLPVRERPDLTVELLSRSTAANDLGPKLSIYERAGVAEYWTADPATGALMVFVREGEAGFVQAEADSDGRVHSKLLGADLRVVRDKTTFEVLQ